LLIRKANNFRDEGGGSILNELKDKMKHSSDYQNKSNNNIRRSKKNMVIQRWNPYRELRQVEDTMDRLWHGFGGPAVYREGSEDWNILIDVMQKKDDIIVTASIPGVKPEEIDVAVEDNVLTIRAERKPESEEDANYLIRERPVGSFFRALRLPDTVDTENIESSYCNGVY
jgi:HSP20 family protein